ncbi:hypothetical protein L2E82_47819 [Cichorium intybus]|uniref:Uncharacterized protein n=1 Tax=Cichorium intybus TaxID=13427 RepID=A0ACB8YVR6_CICIN|nr:hypothetical protein L2E82_47819 [Cichorium intybus]
MQRKDIKSNDFAKALVFLVGCCCEVLSHTGMNPQMALNVKLLHKGEDLFIVCKPESFPVSPIKATRVDSSCACDRSQYTLLESTLFPIQAFEEHDELQFRLPKLQVQRVSRDLINNRLLQSCCSMESSLLPELVAFDCGKWVMVFEIPHLSISPLSLRTLKLPSTTTTTTTTTGDVSLDKDDDQGFVRGPRVPWKERQKVRYDHQKKLTSKHFAQLTSTSLITYNPPLIFLKLTRNEKRKEEMKREVWDCGSSLYDSFELKSLQHQLNSAISARTMSMPHLSNRSQPQPTVGHNEPYSKKHSKISRSLHKFIRSIFRHKHNHHTSSKDRAFHVYDTSTALSTIPEATETLLQFDGLSPEMKSLVTRTRSDRFMSTSRSISCV